MASSPGLVLSYWMAMLLRFYLISDTKLELSERVEIATPINSFKRLSEGVALYRQGVDPYSGVLYHETPLTLMFMEKISRRFPGRINNMFLLFDVLTAYLFGCIASSIGKRILKVQEKNRKKYHKDASEMVVKEPDVAHLDLYAQLAYLFNPYIVTSCAAKSTTVLANLILALFILSMLKKSRFFGTLFLALATYQSLYAVMLIVPLVVILTEDDKSSPTWRHAALKKVLPIVAPFVLALGGLLYGSYALLGYNASFLGATYGFILSVPELTPNMGLFWYFFTEMFEHYRIFFVCTFQINVFIYVIPLTIRLRKDPFLLAFTLIGLTAIFKSYPSYGDVGFYLSLLPTLKHLFSYTKQLFIVPNMFLATTVLGPLLYHLWIYNGSANANYFFAINLVFGTAQIFLVTDLLLAHVKRDFYLFNGYKKFRMSPDRPNAARLILK